MKGTKSVQLAKVLVWSAVDAQDVHKGALTYPSSFTQAELKQEVPVAFQRGPGQHQLLGSHWKRARMKDA